MMGRLSAAPSRLARAPARLSYGTDGQGHSDALEPWRAWYKTRRWEAVRQAAFRRDNFRCQCGCNTLIQVPSERIGDHKDPSAKLSEARFFDLNEVQTLWKPHHDGPKQRQERADRSR